MPEDITIYLAPIHGFTEAAYRNAFSKCFDGIDKAMSPFVSLVDGKKVKRSHMRDILPENNDADAIPLIPQIMGNNPQQFRVMLEELKSLNYDEVNWNLGCPMRRVARRVRGSGLLPFPERIRAILEEVVTDSPIDISVKSRLGYSNSSEFAEVLNAFQAFPLKYLVLHPRIGVQMYEGPVLRDAFEHYYPDINMPLVYNGDVFTEDDFRLIMANYDKITGVMLGRGLLMDPWLGMKIKGMKLPSDNDKRDAFANFHSLLFEATFARLSRESQQCGKIKEFWKYFAYTFEGGSEFFKKIAPMHNATDMIRLCEGFIKEADFRL